MKEPCPVIGTITSLYAALGDIAAVSSFERLGRKHTLVFGATVLMIGRYPWILHSDRFE
ncbi:hypothetical protein JVU11DRAFT_8294 [Chiua virens]|nr:hypothetical protein JVU11DRAFT_8294 [Chiua virens]